MDVHDYAITWITLATGEVLSGCSAIPTVYELILNGATRRGETFTRNHECSSTELYRAKRRGGVIGITDRMFDLQDARETARVRAHTYTRDTHRARARAHILAAGR